MPKMIVVTALAMGAVFLATQSNPASAQVMKNFSFKKKQKPAKARPEPQMNAVAAPRPSPPGGRETPKSKDPTSR